MADMTAYLKMLGVHEDTEGGDRGFRAYPELDASASLPDPGFPVDPERWARSVAKGEALMAARGIPAAEEGESPFTGGEVTALTPGADYLDEGLDQGVDEGGTKRYPRRKFSEQAVRLTERDENLLAALCPLGGATQPMLAHTLCAGMSRTAVFNMLNRLKRAGYLEPLSGPEAVSNNGRPRDVHALYVPTKKAYKLVGCDLAYKPLAMDDLRHTLAVAEVALDLIALGCVVTFEREIERARRHWQYSRDEQPPTDALWLTYGGGTHVPDMVVFTPDGGRVAVEVELSAKSETALRRNLYMYADAQQPTHQVNPSSLPGPQFSGIVYFLAGAKTKVTYDRVLASIPEARRPDIEVRDYVPGHSPKQ